jgi:hypothetical protein
MKIQHTQSPFKATASSSDQSVISSFLARLAPLTPRPTLLAGSVEYSRSLRLKLSVEPLLHLPVIQLGQLVACRKLFGDIQP